MAKKVFITRELSDVSPFKHLEGSFEVTGMSLLEFRTIPIDQMPSSDWLFFYSQQGVIHFTKQAAAAPGQKIAAFGPRTAKLCSQRGLRMHFIGNGKAVQTAEAFGYLAQNSSICFIRAKRSLQSVQSLLSGTITRSDLVVYDNHSRDDFEDPQADILIFTSPLNAKTYFSKYPLRPLQIVIAIGATTAQTLQALGIAKVLMPHQASEESLVDLVKSF